MIVMKMKLNAHFLQDEQLGNICFATPDYESNVDGSIIARFDDNFLYILKDLEELKLFDAKEKKLNERIFGHILGDGIEHIGIKIDGDHHIFLRTLKCVLKDGNLGVIDYHKQLM